MSDRLICKKVVFNLNRNTIHQVYSKQDYDRKMIDSIMYLKCYNRVSEQEWRAMLEEMAIYKFHHMLIHKSSIASVTLK